MLLGACPRIRRGRAHGAWTASARREEEAMSMYIVDDKQRSDRRQTPMRPLGSGLEGASASLALLDDVHRHRLRRAALHLPLPSQERGPFQFSDRLLGFTAGKKSKADSVPFTFENAESSKPQLLSKSGFIEKAEPYESFEEKCKSG